MASNALAKNRKTPGVYVTEFAAFPPSIVGVATAVPIFIGYTAMAADPSSGKQMFMTAVPVSSMADYVNYFGGGFDAKGVVQPGIAATAAASAIYDFQAPSMSVPDAANPPVQTLNMYVVGTSNTATGIDTLPQFNLYSAMQLFYANGGGNCFVISVASYVDDSGAAVTIDKTALLAGLDVSNVTRGGTMLVVPDACLLAPTVATKDNPSVYADYGTVVCAMMTQASALQDRVAILDMPGALDPAFWSPAGMLTQANAFYDEIAPAAPYFSYGAAYAPALESSLLSLSDVSYTNLWGTPGSQVLVNNLLTSQALTLYPNVKDASGNAQYAPSFVAIAARIAAAFPAGTSTPYDIPSAGVTGTVVPAAPLTPVPAVATAATTPPPLLVSVAAPTLYALPTGADTTADKLAAAEQALDQYLLNAVPLMGQIQQILANQLNVVPPSGVMAGIWTQNDANRGVWNAPANLSLNEVISPKVNLTDLQQGDFNVPLNGNAIDILRAMVNRGTVVWGARTLDGNSLDYRYIQVRRTLIYIEQSIKTALEQFVFAANDGGTWTTVTATISNFLTQFWQAGGLMGDKASDAFTVACGVPTTMSGLDVLNGYMIVNVTVQLIHPAEFIELTFSQTMQGV